MEIMKTEFVKNNFDLVLGFKGDKLVFQPWWVIGFSDAEGCFVISLVESENFKFKVNLRFEITQSNHSKGILLELQKFLGCGYIKADWKDCSKFIIGNVEDLYEKVIPHFNQYPLKTSKYLNYLAFREVVILVRNKEHILSTGIEKIKSIKENYNKQRSFDVKFDYLASQKIELNSEWIQAFVAFIFWMIQINKDLDFY
jgi:hypothetical protein